MKTSLDARPLTTDAPPRARKPRKARKGRNVKRLVAAVAALPVAAFVAAYLVFFTPDSPARLKLSTPEHTASLLGVGAGEWSVGAGSVAGYRVREKLLKLPAPNDAVGRTGAVRGSLILDTGDRGFVVEQGMRVVVDVSTLTSDEARRDEHMHTMAIESDRYPTASFVSTADVVVPAPAVAAGAPVTVSVPGDLTLHGVTRPVTIPVQAQRNGDRIEVVASFSFPWDLFGMKQPDLSYVTVESNPTLELQLFFERAAGPPAPAAR